jgi:multiple sugar transport system permease protein
MTTGAAQIDAVWTPAIPEGRRGDRSRFSWSSIPLLLPALALIALLFLGPVIYSIYLGFTNLALTGPTALHYHWTGSANLHQLVNDPVFHHALVVTAIYVVGSSVIGTTAVGLAIALAMQKAYGVLRLLVGAVVMVCFMLPPVTVAIVWYAASTGGGTFPILFGSANSDLLNTAPLVFVSAANCWSLAGLAMLLFSAALRNIPEDIVESAKLESAGPVQRFWHITLPLLRPTIVTTILLMTLLSLANYTIVYIMTAGGPGTATTILPIYSYQEAFQFGHLAYGALVGNVMVLITAALAAVYVWLSRGKRRATT